VALISIGPQTSPHLRELLGPVDAEAESLEPQRSGAGLHRQPGGATAAQGNAGLSQVGPALARTQLEAAVAASIEATLQPGGKHWASDCPLDRLSKACRSPPLAEATRACFNPGNTDTP